MKKRIAVALPLAIVMLGILASVAEAGGKVF